MNAPENPPAFPQQCADALDVGMVHEGMTLRDWFAGQALAGYIAHLGGQGIHVGSYTDECATEAFMLADAMLAARSKGEEA